MNFSWTDEELALKQRITQFAQKDLNQNAIELDKTTSFDYENWKKCADFGIQGFAATNQYGGQGTEIDLLKAVLAMEGFGYGCEDNGLAFALNAQMWTVQLPIVQFGTDAQKCAKFIPKMVSGEWIAAHALSEPEVGSDVFNMKMTAEKCDGGYIFEWFSANGQPRSYCRRSLSIC